MARKKIDVNRPIESYEHKDKQRVNNPPVGLVTPDTDPDGGTKKSYAYDPHLDPQLQWAGKAEHTSFEVPTVSLHVHERIDPRTIIDAVKKCKEKGSAETQTLLFDMEREEPLRDAVDFYKHAHGWSNRMVAGDSLLVMNSLLEKEGMAGKVQMVYFDPPYGIKYGSNFQPFVNKRDVKDGKDDDLTAEPEQIRAFRDTWELGIHSYLTYLRDRLLLARELLTESGSIFVQISDDNLHHVRELMSEIFGEKNLVALIPFVKTSGQTDKYLASVCDYLVWYAKDATLVTYRQLYKERSEETLQSAYTWIELPDKTCRKLTSAELAGIQPIPEGRRFMTASLFSQGFRTNTSVPYSFNGRTFDPGSDKNWKTTIDGLNRLAKQERLIISGATLCYKRYADDFPVVALNNFWGDTIVSTFVAGKIYVVQTAVKVIERCILMTTNPGDVVFDPTCGSGTTSYVAEKWGRRWITCDTSRVALAIAKQRVMTALFEYYELAHHNEGISSGFKYKTVPHITLKSIASNTEVKDNMTSAQAGAIVAKHAPQEILYDQPIIDNQRARVSGPFTVEAVPAPAVKSIEQILDDAPQPADVSIARSGETLRQAEWRDELLRCGIRGKAGQHICFARLEPLPGCRWLHADGEAKDDTPQRIVVSFGPEHAPLEQRQVAHAIEEAQTLVPKPKLIVFAAFQFDSEAAKDIDETNWPGVTLLKAQMNADLLTDDLKKNRASNESFWLIGQPDVALRRIQRGPHRDKWEVEVHGFDYYNTKTGGIESGSDSQIAVWMLDTDYDGRSLYPRQVFFPMAGATEGWARLAKNLKAEIDDELIEAYRGTVSLPFEPGEQKRVAVKIVDDRGIESLKVIALG